MCLLQGNDQELLWVLQNALSNYMDRKSQREFIHHIIFYNPNWFQRQIYEKLKTLKNCYYRTENS